MPESDPNQKQAKESALQQYQSTLDQLSTNPPVGRRPIRISVETLTMEEHAGGYRSARRRHSDRPEKAELRDGDGTSLQPTAIAYRPGKSAKWYLGQAGGPTLLGEKKAMFVVRADGSVIGMKNGMWSGDSFDAVLQPGDTVVVPERMVGGPVQWQLLFSAAQVASAVASTLYIALHY